MPDTPKVGPRAIGMTADGLFYLTTPSAREAATTGAVPAVAIPTSLDAWDDDVTARVVEAMAPYCEYTEPALASALAALAQEARDA
jgi:hypothetical protein